MTEKRKQTRTILVLAIVLVVVVAVILGVYLHNRPELTAGDKTITLTVITDETTNTHQISTDAVYLGAALKPGGLVAGEDSQYGLYVKTVDGITVDEAKMQWWCLTKGGAEVYTGVDETPIEDGDTFEFTLTTGY
ncbi:MAG: DUF4430 domain-containing protein [Oscillospiraceae bacterium]|nr:DUF4430 domain-containing protein [Oscillospiraceae bacterium]